MRAELDAKRDDLVTPFMGIYDDDDWVKAREQCAPVPVTVLRRICGPPMMSCMSSGTCRHWVCGHWATLGQ